MSVELIVRKQIVINANASGVWEAITNPASTKKYMDNSEVISDWKRGNSIIWRDTDNKKVHVKGTIIEFDPGLYLKTKDLSNDSGLPDKESNYSIVTYKLNDENGKTLLIITEDNFNGDKKRFTTRIITIINFH